MKISRKLLIFYSNSFSKLSIYFLKYVRGSSENNVVLKCYLSIYFLYAYYILAAALFPYLPNSNTLF